MTHEANKALVRAYLNGLVNEADSRAIERYISPDVVFNEGLDVMQILAGVEARRAAFPDFRLTIEDQIAEGDKVVTRVVFSGTHHGAFNGVAPTGRRITYPGTAIDRIADGKVVEMWHISDALSFMRQLSALPTLQGTQGR